jgi:hypothetical protein
MNTIVNQSNKFIFCLNFSLDPISHMKIINVPIVCNWNFNLKGRNSYRDHISGFVSSHVSQT